MGDDMNDKMFEQMMGVIGDAMNDMDNHIEICLNAMCRRLNMNIKRVEIKLYDDETHVLFDGKYDIK